MVPIGLTFDEYVDLKVRPRASADRAFHNAAETELTEMFPMNLVAASSHLRSRGYDCRPQMLDLLVRNEVVTPANPDALRSADTMSISCIYSALCCPAYREAAGGAREMRFGESKDAVPESGADREIGGSGVGRRRGGPSAGAEAQESADLGAGAASVGRQGCQAVVVGLRNGRNSPSSL